MIRRAWPVALSLVLAACGGGAAAGGGEGTLPDASAPGAQVVVHSGCTSCHRIGEIGNPGPGKELTHIGSRRSRERLRRTLGHPPGGMPAYDTLPRAQLDALLDYLSARQ